MSRIEDAIRNNIRALADGRFGRWSDAVEDHLGRIVVELSDGGTVLHLGERGFHYERGSTQLDVPYRQIESVKLLNLRELMHALYHTPHEQPIALKLSLSDGQMEIELSKPLYSGLANLLAILPRIAREENA